MARTPVCSFSKLVVFAALLAGVASAQTRSRIVQNIAEGESVAISPAHPLARAEFDQGRVEGSLKISRAAIVFKLSSTQQAALDKLLADQQNPHSANYHKWLTPEQYAARFGMSDADLAKVSAWLKSQGLSVDGYSRARTRIFFSGSAAQVESAFQTELHRYLVDGETSLANATEVSVPQALSSVVLSVRGLDTFRPGPELSPRMPTSLLTYREIIFLRPVTLPPSTISNRCTPRDSMAPGKRLPWSGKLKSIPPTLTPFALPPDCQPRI